MFQSKAVKEYQRRNANKFPEKNVDRSQENRVRMYLSKNVRMFQSKSVPKCQSRNARTFPVRSVGVYLDRAAKKSQSKTAQLFTSVLFVHNQAISQHQHTRDRLIVTDLNHLSVQCSAQCTQSYHATYSNCNGLFIKSHFSEGIK